MRITHIIHHIITAPGPLPTTAHCHTAAEGVGPSRPERKMAVKVRGHWSELQFVASNLHLLDQQQHLKE